MDNRNDAGLGLPLPAGSFTLYGERDGRPFLLGEGRMSDRAVGEAVEVDLEGTPGVIVGQRQVTTRGKERSAEVVVTNDQRFPIRFEARFGDERAPLTSSEKLSRRDGANWWVVTVPGNASRKLTLRYRAGN
jgi:hypothetical protein